MRAFFRKLWQMIMESNLPGIIGAMLILLIGWVIALWLSGKVVRAIRHCIQWQKHGAGGQGDIPENTGKIAGRVTYWIVMILALLGSMSLLRLEYAAVPLREFVTAIASYLPNVAGALILLLIAHVFAGIIRHIMANAVAKEQVRYHLDKLGTNSEKAMRYTSETGAFLVYLFFLPAILNTLGIYGITAPLQTMFAVVLAYLPRIVAAMIILAVGLWAAKVVYRAVGGALMMAKLDVLGNWCGFSPSNSGYIARFIGAVCWVLVAIPVILAALTALDIEMLSRPLSDFMALLLAGAGNIIAALLVVLAAVIVGRIVKNLAARLAAAVGVDNIPAAVGLKKVDFEKYPLSGIIGMILYISIIVIGLLGACEMLQLSFVASIIHRFAVFGGNLILSAVILLVGVALAEFAVRMTGEKLGNCLGGAVKAAVIIFSVALALSNLGTGAVVAETAFAMIIGAFCVAFALAFGLGGREFASGLLRKWFDKKN